IGSVDHPWSDEPLRVATGGSAGDPTTQPAVYSHLAGVADFPSFPVDVPTCLATPVPLPPPPPLKDPVPPGPPTKADFCIVWGEAKGPQVASKAICGDIAKYVKAAALATPAASSCLYHTLKLVCPPVSHEGTV